MSKTANYKKVIEILMSDRYDAKKLLTEIAKNNPGRFLKTYYALYEKNDRFSGIRDLLKAGKKIPAIKEYRNLTGKDLRESKEGVDKIEAEMRL